MWKVFFVAMFLASLAFGESLLSVETVPTEEGVVTNGNAACNGGS